MSDTKGNAQKVQDTPLTIREHLDPDKHWIGETLAPPTQTEIAATIGTVSGPGDSPFVARADHIHKLASTIDVITINGQSGGALWLQGTQVAILRTGSPTRPLLSFFNTDKTTRYGYIAGASTGMEFQSETFFSFFVGGTEYARLFPAVFLLGKTAQASNIAAEGIEIHGGAAAFWITRATNGSQIQLNKIGSGAVVNGTFINFLNEGTGMGSITRASATVTAFNTSSDEEKKQDIVEVDDELAEWVARIVQPYMFSWKEIPDQTVMGYIAQRIVAVWPEAIEHGLVSPPTTDDDGNEIGWMVDSSKMVPILHAAWQSSARKLDALTKRVEALENGRS